MLLKVINTGSKNGNCYALQSESGEILLLDCGCKYREILKGISYQTSNVSGCLLTHIHGDHLKSFRELMNVGIQIYTNDETVEELNIITGELMKGVPERKRFKAGAFLPTPFYLPHTKLDKETNQLIQCSNFGYLVEHEEMGKLLYMTDFEYCRYNFRGMRINHLVIECNYNIECVDKEAVNYRHKLKGHCSLTTCKTFVESCRTSSLKTITLIHLSEDTADPIQIKREIQEVAGEDVLVQIARPGLEVNLNLCPF